jgi:hypothetical protein
MGKIIAKSAKTQFLWVLALLGNQNSNKKAKRKKIVGKKFLDSL